jgi:MOSC domain-containing protein YiiM
VTFDLKVMPEGEVGAGDSMELMHQDSHEVTVADVARLYRDGSEAFSLLQRAVRLQPYLQAGALIFSSRSTGFNVSP